MREDPEETLRRRPDLTLLWRVLPDGMNGCWQPGRITLDPRLTRVEARCTLMHELVHDERRIGWPFATAATMEKEEALVRKEAAMRLVPLDELEALMLARDGVDQASAYLVAEEFDVTTTVAGTALRELYRVLLDRARAAAARDAA